MPSSLFRARDVLGDTRGRPHDQIGRSPLAAGDVRTFLIADIRGYTRYTQEHGDVRASELAARFAQLVRAEVPEWNGQLLELRGDEALCVLPPRARR